jgi:uncharacterized protein DUF2630
MNDPDIFGYINDLSAEEERLYASAADGSGLTAHASERLETIRVELDRCFDLLHQREARRRAGADPKDAALRPAEVVERYQQ